MNTLYYMPRTCGMGIHILLEEIGLHYKTVKIDLKKGEQHSEAFRAINPKQKLPVLRRPDGTILTEFPAIGVWLATSNPETELLELDPENLCRTLEVTDYVVSTLHMQAWSRFWKPDHHSGSKEEHAAIQARGTSMALEGLKILDEALAGRQWVTGKFSIADCALFYIEFWAVNVAHWPVPTSIMKHYDAMIQRPSVLRVLEWSGE